MWTLFHPNFGGSRWSRGPDRRCWEHREVTRINTKYTESKGYAAFCIDLLLSFSQLSCTVTSCMLTFPVTYLPDAHGECYRSVNTVSDYGRFFEENVWQDKDMDCMAVDVFMGTLVLAGDLRRVHTARPASHRREFYVRFVGTCSHSHRDHRC